MLTAARVGCANCLQFVRASIMVVIHYLANVACGQALFADRDADKVADGGTRTSGSSGPVSCITAGWAATRVSHGEVCRSEVQFVTT